MIIHDFRRLTAAGLLLVSLGFSQLIPMEEPRLLFLPSMSGGASYFSLVPTQNLQLSSSLAGWTIADTMRGVAATFDIELVRYNWWDQFFKASKFDTYSSLGYSLFNQLGSTSLPANYPSSFELNKVLVSGFSLNAMIREFYLDHHLSYAYSQRGNLHGNLSIGLTHLSLYRNGAGIRILESNGLGIHLGIGWQTTLFGRIGERIRFGVDLGYSIRSFDLTEQDENLKLADGSAGSVSPIQKIAYSTPDLKVSLEFGEALFAAFTPYRDPFTLGLLNLSLGTGLINYKPGVSIGFDSTGTTISFPFGATISQYYDLQLFKYNWPFLFIRQANIDVFSGVGVRRWKSSQATSLPDGWARVLTAGTSTFSGLTFAPRVTDIYLDHEILFPLGPKLHAKLTVGNGYATMTLYENVVLDRLIDAAGITWQMGMGLGYTFQGDGSSKVNLGLSFNYLHQAFKIDMDNSNLSPVTPGEIIPINFLDLSQATISFDIGLIFGGNVNEASRAHKAFKQKHYSRALDLQRELLLLNPDHHNRDAILLEIEMVEDSLTTRYYRDVNTVLTKGELHNAHALIKQGEAPPGKEVEKAVKEMQLKIADQALIRAAAALKNLDYEQAEEFILLALRSDPAAAEIAKVLLARSYFIRASILYQSGVYGRSLYWLKQVDGLTDRYKLLTVKLRQKIGDGRLDDANEGILKEDREMVYESMKDAKALNPVLTGIVDEHLSDLKRAIEIVEEERLTPLKRMALDNLLDDVQGLDPENFTPRIGMKGSLISQYVGPPERRFKEGDYELWVYPRPENIELWLYLRNGKVEKIEYQE